MNKLKLILTASIATALTISCSDGEGGSTNGISDTEVFTLKSKNADSFTFVEDELWYECTNGGILKQMNDTYERTMNYSIKNTTMTLKQQWGNENDTLNFKGTSNNLIGTWTRTKNKDASCGYEYDNYDNEYYYECKEGWDITKVVITEKNVSVTYDICYTDELNTMQDRNGWKQRVVDCNTYEIYKGSDKITVKLTIKTNEYSQEISYKGKSCKYSEHDYSKSERESACKEAWNKYKDDNDWEDYYYDILRKNRNENRKDYEDCMKKYMPSELMENDDKDESVIAKAKAKFKPLSKKLN